MIGRLLELVRLVAGVAALLWAARQAIVAFVTRPRYDGEYGLRITPLTPAETRAARELEAALLPPSVRVD